MTLSCGSRVNGIPERVGRGLRGTERQPLRLEVGVLDGELQDVPIQGVVLGERGRTTAMRLR
jgi:hypothetical protein